MPRCLFCTQPQVESKIFYGPDIIDVCQSHGGDLSRLHKDVRPFFSEFSKNYTIVVMSVPQLKVGDLSHQQSLVVYVKDIKEKFFPSGQKFYKITFGLVLSSHTPGYDSWYLKLVRCHDDLCIKLIENSPN